jgi:hypothetical protein
MILTLSFLYAINHSRAEKRTEKWYLSIEKIGKTSIEELF